MSMLRESHRASGEDSTGSFESKAAILYALPFGKSQRWVTKGWAEKVAGDWQISAILTYNNSQPMQISQQGESFLNGINRPNINPLVSLWSGNYNKIKPFFEKKIPTAPFLFSTNAWSNTGSEYVLGDAKRAYNAVRGPWFPVENLNAIKRIHLPGGSWLTLRIDYFNALNRTQLPFPTTGLGASNFGQVTGKFAGGNRQGQLEVAYNF